MSKLGSRISVSLAVLLLLFTGQAKSAFGQETPVLTPGNLVVVVEGCGVHGGTCTSVPNGSGTGTGNSSAGGYGDNQASPLTLFQYTPNGTASVNYVNSLVLPQTGSGANLPVSGEYGSSSEGTLQLDGTGRYLTLMGYGINAGTFDAAYYPNPGFSGDPYGAAPSGALAQSGSLTGQSYTPVARVLSLIDPYGNVNSATALYNIFNTNNPRSVYSIDGTSVAYVSGQGTGCDETGGVFLIPIGLTTNAPTAITGGDAAPSSSCITSGYTGTTIAQDTRTVQVYGNTLYISIDSTEGKSDNRSMIGTLGTPPATTLFVPSNPPTGDTGGPNLLPGWGNTGGTGKVTITSGASSNGNSFNASLQINVSPSNYFFANASTLYVADTGSPKQTSATSNLGDGGLQKWVNSASNGSGTWSLAYTLYKGLNLVKNPTNTPANTSGATGLYGLTGVVSGSNVYLYATNYNISDLDPTYLYGITDNLSTTTNPSTSFTLLDTAPADSNFKGVSFAPSLPAGSATITSSPSGLAFSSTGTGCADGTYTTPVTLIWTPGNQCELSVITPQTESGAQYTLTQWQDGTTSASDTVTAPATSAVYTASFSTAYELTTSAGTGGSVSAGGYFAAGTNATVTATPSAGYYFLNFTGTTTSTSNPLTVSMSGPQTITANFAPQVTPTVTFPTASAITYGEMLASSTLSGGSASVSGTFGFTAPSTVPPTGTAAQSVTFTPTNLTEYTSVIGTVNVAVNQANASVTPNLASKVYGQADPPLTGTLTGFLASDGVTATYSRTPGEAVAGSPYTISATLSPSGVLSNYYITYNTAPFTITQAPAAVSLSNLSQTYNGSPEPVIALTTPAGLAVSASYTGINSTSYGPSTSAPTNPGSYSVVAIVVDPNYAGQQSGTLTINQVDPTLNLSLMSGMPVSTPYGTTVYFDLAMASAPQCPTGTVQLYIDGTASGSPTALSGASCSQPLQFQTAALTAGQHSIYAAYSGDTYFEPENSGTLSYTVTQDATSVTLAASSSSVNVGQSLTFTATVIPAPPDNALPPSGNVIFFDGTNQIGTGTALTVTAPYTYTSTFTTSSLPAGPHSISATFVDTDGNFAGNSSPVNVETVNLIVPTISWAPSPTEFPYGTPLGSTQLNATAVDSNNNPVSGSFKYNFPNGTILAAGTVNLTATFTPADPTTYAANSAMVTLTVTQATPTVTFTGAPSVAPGNSSFTVTATTNASTTASITASGACSIAGTTVTMTATTGTCLLTASWAADANYLSASATQSTAAEGAAPTITWATPSAITYGTALSGAQLDATATYNGAKVAGSFVYTPAKGTVLGAGTQTLSVVFTPTNTTNYSPVTASVTLTVNPASTKITWAKPASITYGATLTITQLDATAPVPGTFTYSPAAGSVLMAGTQTLSVTFTPNDATDYENSADTITITVDKATPTVTWPTPAAISYGTPLSAAQLDATASVPGAFNYSPALGTVPAGGTQTLSAIFTPNDSTDYTNVKATVSLQVGSSTPTITWATPASITYGTALSGTQLNATATYNGATVAGTYAYTPPKGTVLGAGTQILSVLFTPSNTNDYATASAATTLQVNQATPKITWAKPAAITFGTQLSSTQLDATASVLGTFVYTPVAGTVLAAGTDTLSVNFTPSDTVDYTTQTATTTITVKQ
jgi:hypothetical protein